MATSDALRRFAADGIELVTIPLADYAALIRARERLAHYERPRSVTLPRSPIDADPMLRDFIVSRLGKMRLSDVATACATAFGKRAPSKSAIHRFATRFGATGEAAATSASGIGSAREFP